MVLNTDKTKVMLITSGQKDPVLSLKYSDIDIRMTHDKILGGTCG